MFFKALEIAWVGFLATIILNLSLWNVVLATAPIDSVLNHGSKPIVGSRLYKEVRPVDGMVNQWDVTLRIEADKTRKSSDVVLVID